MKRLDLFVWRHAEAEEGFPDLARRLTPKGRRDAATVAATLADSARGARLLVSPAVRTRETVEPLVADGRFVATLDPRLAPGSALAQVLAAIDEATRQGGTDAAKLVVVGHQPWVGQLARHLLAGDAGDWRFRKAAAWWLVRRAHDGDVEWSLRTVFDPDLLAR